MTPAEIQFSHSLRLLFHEALDKLHQLSEEEIEESIKRIDEVTTFLFTRKGKYR
jgi:hypothetical protein